MFSKIYGRVHMKRFTLSEALKTYGIISHHNIEHNNNSIKLFDNINDNQLNTKLKELGEAILGGRYPLSKLHIALKATNLTDEQQRIIFSIFTTLKLEQGLFSKNINKFKEKCICKGYVYG